MTRAKQFLIASSLIFLASIGFGQRKVYRAGETKPAAEIPMDTTDNRPQKAREGARKEEICNCNNDLSFDPTTNIALNKNKPGNPPFTGKCVAFYPNKKPEMQLSFLNGVEEGTWIFFYESGDPKMIKNYAEGKTTWKMDSF